MNDSNTKDKQLPDVHSGLELILEAIGSSLFLRGRTSDIYYSKKFVKLIVITIMLLSLSACVIWFVFDVGYNTSRYATDTETGLYTVLKQQTSEQNAQNEEEAEAPDSIGYVLQFFLQRKNSVIIYTGMIVLLIAFNVSIFKRIRYLWQNYLERYDVERRVFYNDEDYANQLELIATEDKPGFCKLFIGKLFTSFKQEGNKQFFSQYYQDFYNTEETKNDLFVDSANRSAVWIIRLGIFGTLLGIAVAFFELWYAMSGVNTESGLEQIFITQVQQALLGNGLAVATSLAAHGATLILEIGVSYFLRNENNLNWLNIHYSKLLALDVFRSKTTDIDDELTKVSTNVKLFDESITMLNKNMREILPDFTSMKNNFSDMVKHSTDLNQNMVTMTGKLDDMHSIYTHASDNMKFMATSTKEISEYSQTLDDTIKNLQQNVDTMNNNLERFSKFTRSFIEAMVSIGERTVGSMKNSIGKIAKNVKQ